MSNSSISQNLGFLTVIDHEIFGLVGGYLILNPTGRPLEFHCTSPVKPNRAQEILYGNTLEPYLYGEQIARVLLSRAKTPTRFVLTDAAAVLAAYEWIDKPLVYVFRQRKPSSAPIDLIELAERAERSENREPAIEISEELNESLRSFGIENARAQAARNDEKDKTQLIPSVPGLNTDLWEEFKIGNRIVALPEIDGCSRATLLEEIKTISRTVDLVEPFTRIRLAIEEAQRAA